jgi:hypothetical protein
LYKRESVAKTESGFVVAALAAVYEAAILVRCTAAKAATTNPSFTSVENFGNKIILV